VIVVFWNEPSASHADLFRPSTFFPLEHAGANCQSSEIVAVVQVCNQDLQGSRQVGPAAQEWFFTMASKAAPRFWPTPFISVEAVPSSRWCRDGETRADLPSRRDQ